MPADLGKLQICLAGDHVVRQTNNGLGLSFVADLGTAENDREIRAEPPQCEKYFVRLGHVPDVNSETDNARLVRQQYLHNVEWALIDVELNEAGPGSQLAEIRKQVTQSERSVDEFGVKGGKDYVRHRTWIIVSILPQTILRTEMLKEWMSFSGSLAVSFAHILGLP